MSGNKKTTYHMGDKGIETKTTQELSTGARVNIPVTEEVVTNSKDIVADLTPGVGIPDKKVLGEWDSEEYKEKMKNSWKPSNC